MDTFLFLTHSLDSSSAHATAATIEVRSYYKDLQQMLLISAANNTKISIFVVILLRFCPTSLQISSALLQTTAERRSHYHTKPATWVSPGYKAFVLEIGLVVAFSSLLQRQPIRNQWAHWWKVHCTEEINGKMRWIATAWSRPYRR